LRYVETELAKKRGKMVDVGQKEEMDHVDELYTVPDHLKVCLQGRSQELHTGGAEHEI
jgi:hypothetical protein